jgi:ferredoxin
VAQDRIIERGLHVWTIDADRVARDAGLGSHINTIMQTCFFAISGVMPKDKAIEKIKYSIRKTYGKKGEAAEATGRRSMRPYNLHKVEIAAATSTFECSNRRRLRDGFRQARDGRNHGRTRRPAAGVGVLIKLPTGPPHNKRTWLNPVWDEDITVRASSARIPPSVPVFLIELAKDAPSTSSISTGGGIRAGHGCRRIRCTGRLYCELCVEICPADPRPT